MLTMITKMIIINAKKPQGLTLHEWKYCQNWKTFQNLRRWSTTEIVSWNYIILELDMHWWLIWLCHVLENVLTSLSPFLKNYGFFNCLTIISSCSQFYFSLFSLSLLDYSLPVKHSTDLCEFMILLIGMG